MTSSPLKAASKLEISDEEIRGETIYFVVLDRFNVGINNVYSSIS